MSPPQYMDFLLLHSECHRGSGVRGGSWLSAPQEVRSAFRGALTPGDRLIALGFRCLIER